MAFSAAFNSSSAVVKCHERTFLLIMVEIRSIVAMAPSLNFSRSDNLFCVENIF